jgi:hypothetical protein
MTEAGPTANRAWKVATAAFAVIAAGAGVFGYVEYSALGALTAQLAAADEEAQQATDEETRLRSQLGEAQDRTNTQAQKLVAAEQQASAEQQQLAAARRQASAELQQLPSAPERGATEPLHELPIRLTFHDAMFRAGKVAVLQNLSDSDLEVTLEVQSPASGAHTRRRLVVNAHGLLRFGPAQGWPFAPGQVVTLNNEKYRPMVQKVS